MSKNINAALVALLEAQQPMAYFSNLLLEHHVRSNLREVHPLILEQGKVSLSLLRKQVERAGLRQTDILRGNNP